MTAPRVLVAGIGNVFFGDDGFGSEVASRLVEHRFPESVRVQDFGIRGVHLAYELLDGCDALVLVDAVPMGESPGTVALIEAEVPAPGDVVESETPLDAHTMNPDVVLQTLAKLGGYVEHVVVVGCEPERIEPSMGLSPAVEAAVDPTVDRVAALVHDLCRSREETRT